MSNLFNEFSNFDIPVADDDETTETKFFELQSYADYIADQEKKSNKNTDYQLPKDVKANKDLLKIIKYKTNKHSIKQRQMMERDIIPQHPSSVIFNGRSGSGKSNLLVNLLTRPEFYGRIKESEPKTHYFDLIWLFSPTCYNDDLAKYLDIPENRMFDSDFDKPLEHIITTQKNLIEKKGMERSPKILIIFDDVQSQERFMRSPNFTKMFIQNRHHNISTWVCCQSFTRLPRVCRLQANNLFIFRSSGSETEILVNEFCPPNTKKREFEQLVKHATKERFNFLHINMRCEAERRYRRNLDTILKIKNQ